jgi:hypothetical protein
MLEEAEMIQLADSPDASLPEKAELEIVRQWVQAYIRLGRNTLAVQAIFDDIEEHCPGKTPDADCNYPSDLA